MDRSRGHKTRSVPCFPGILGELLRMDTLLQAANQERCVFQCFGPPLKLVHVGAEAQGRLEALDSDHQRLSGDPQGAAERGAFLPWGRAALGDSGHRIQVCWTGKDINLGGGMKAEDGNGTQVPSWTMEEVFPCTVTKFLVLEAQFQESKHLRFSLVWEKGT